MSDESKILEAIADLKGHVERQGTIHLENHQRVVAKLDEHGNRIGALEGKLGTPSKPPPGVAIANEAKRTASDASLENESTRGMVLALDAKVAELAKALEENNTMTKRILENVAGPIGSILRAKPVQAAAMAVLLAALGAAGAMLQNRATGPLMLPSVGTTTQDGGAQ